MAVLCKREHSLPSNFENKVPGTDWKWLMEAYREIEGDVTSFTGKGRTASSGGEWRNGQRHGKGAIETARDNSYYGDWVNGRREGHGLFVSTENDRYEGAFKNNLFHGHGDFCWKGGNRYNGEWTNGCQEGFGTYYWGTNGYWLHHEQSGHGKLVWANGNAFEGTWVRGDKREGEFFEKPSGRRFQGKLPPSSEIQVDPSMLCEELQECYQQGKCTFSFTGKDCYLQYLYQTRRNDGTTHGVCVPCYNECVPANKIHLYSPLCQYGGNFSCECGAGLLGKKCLCID